MICYNRAKLKTLRDHLFMPMPIFVAIAIAVAIVVVSGIAAKVLDKKWGRKKLAIFGERNTGKTALFQFFTTGEIPLEC